MTHRPLLLLAALSLLALAGCKKANERLRIAVVPKGTTHEFWKSVHAGAVKASQEENVDIIWKGPLKEDDLKGQIDVVDAFVAQGVSGIVLAPLSDKGLVVPVKNAAAANIPVVVFDSDLQGSTQVSFVATDNYEAGKLAGEAMAGLLTSPKTVVVLRYQEASASTMNRERGFLDAMKAHPEIQVLSDNQYGGATAETALAASEPLLNAQKAQSGAVGGVFCPNESTTFGMLLALKKQALTKKVHFIGFDSSEKLVGALRDGDIDALVVQDPFKIGYLATKTMADYLRKKPIEKRIDTEAKLVKKDNLDSPEMKALLEPDLKRWLGE